MHFFNEPKITRIARHLHNQFASLHQSRRAEFLSSVKNNDAFLLTLREQDPLRILASEQSNTPALFRSKEYFSWILPMSDDRESPNLKFMNGHLQTVFCEHLTNTSNQILEELNKPAPNYDSITQLIRVIRESSCKVPSVVGGETIHLKVGRVGSYSGMNLIFDLFAGIGGLIYAPIAALAALFLIPFYRNGQSLYCGSPQFFLDTARYFCDSLCKVICAVFFPLAIIRSKLTTDSFNPLKGEIVRCLDSIEALAKHEMELAPSMAPCPV